MEKELRAYLVELFGTFGLVFLTAALYCVVQLRIGKGEPSVGLVGVAVGMGCIVAVLLSVSTRVSEGCLNPAISLMLWVTSRFSGRQAAATIFAQVLGAILAGWLIVLIFPNDVLARSYVGTPHVGESLLASGGRVSFGTLAAGIAIEAALTCLFGLALFSALFDPRRPWFGGILAGMAITACALIGYHLTGAAINPARWLGTAVWQPTVPILKAKSVFSDHPIYWMGPILGALLAGIIYTGLILPPKETKK